MKNQSGATHRRVMSTAFPGARCNPIAPVRTFMGGGITQMKKNSFLLISLLLLSSAWAMGQNGQYRNDQGPASGRHVTVEGCLSEASGNFMLTDQSGTTYQLTGNTYRLKNQVGHTVRVKGFSTLASTVSQTPGSMSEGAADAQTDQAQSDAQMQQAQPTQQAEVTLSVSTFKHVSSSCGATSGSTSGSGSY
jgi:hypothetical protein